MIKKVFVSLLISMSFMACHSDKKEPSTVDQLSQQDSSTDSAKFLLSQEEDLPRIIIKQDDANNEVKAEVDGKSSESEGLEPMKDSDHPMIKKMIPLFSKFPYDPKLKGALPIASISEPEIMNDREEIPLFDHVVLSDEVISRSYGDFSRTDGKEKWFLFHAKHKTIEDRSLFMFVSLNLSYDEITFMTSSMEPEELLLITGFRCALNNIESRPKSVREIKVFLDGNKACDPLLDNKHSDLSMEHLNDYVIDSAFSTEVIRIKE